MKRLAATIAVGAAILVATPATAQAAVAYGPYSTQSTCNSTLKYYKLNGGGPWSSTCTKGSDGWYFFKW